LRHSSRLSFPFLFVSRLPFASRGTLACNKHKSVFAAGVVGPPTLWAYVLTLLCHGAHGRRVNGKHRRFEQEIATLLATPTLGVPAPRVINRHCLGRCGATPCAVGRRRERTLCRSQRTFTACLSLHSRGILHLFGTASISAVDIRCAATRKHL